MSKHFHGAPHPGSVLLDDEGEISEPKANHEALKPLYGKVRVRDICTIDIETRQWVNPYAVGFYDGLEYKDFIGDDCIGAALYHILAPKYVGKWIYAHNGGNFDFLFLLRHLLTPTAEKLYKTEITPLGSCMFRIDVFKLDKKGEKRRAGKKQHLLKWTFIDSARLLPIKLNELGETFGIGKKVELKMSYDDLAKEKNRPLMREYLKQDCVLLYKAIEKMQRIINDLGGQLGATLPSTALDLFRRRYLHEYVYTNRHFAGCADHGQKPEDSACHGCGHDFIRQAYHGGRAEIFRMQFKPSPGHKVAKLFDVNSMYPACMLELQPVGPGYVQEGPHVTEEFVYRNAKVKTGIVECDVFIPPDCYLPPLPIKAEGGKLIFPVGHFHGTWDTAELTLLKEVGGKILKVTKSIWFDNALIFNGFVRSIYKYRNKNDPNWNAGMDWIAKILLNSAYGKFAMRELRTRLIIHPDSPVGLCPIDWKSDIWSEEVRISPSYIVPQLSIHITALARRQLWEILNGVLKRGGRIYYCDTDSVVCSGVELEIGKGLGELKLEDVIVRAEWVLPKLYLIETQEESKKKKREKHLKIKAKGMGPGVRIGTDLGEDELDGQLSEEEFVNLVKYDVPLDRHRLTKLREALRAYEKKALNFPRVIRSPKQMQSEYDKRVVVKGYDTKPLVMSV